MKMIPCLRGGADGGRRQPAFRAGALALSMFAALTLALIASGCGGDEQQPLTPTETIGPLTQTYNNTPESTSKLLKDASDAIKSRYEDGEGVHFTMETTGVSASRSIGLRAEGDMVLPDKLQMTSTNYLTAQPYGVDVIEIGGKVYSRTPSGTGAWQSGDGGMPPRDPRDIAAFMDYARSSRNFGHEVVDGKDTWDVQVVVDMLMYANDAQARTSDPQEISRLEAAKASTVTVDFWIGADNLNIYQMLIRTTSPAAGSDTAQDIFFTNWGEPVLIKQP